MLLLSAHRSNLDVLTRVSCVDERATFIVVLELSLWRRIFHLPRLTTHFKFSSTALLVAQQGFQTFRISWVTWAGREWKKQSTCYVKANLLQHNSSGVRCGQRTLAIPTTRMTMKLLTLAVMFNPMLQKHLWYVSIINIGHKNPSVSIGSKFK